METIDAGKLLDDLRNLLEGAEDLMQATAGDASEKVSHARRQMEQSLESTRKQVQEADRYVVRRIRSGARTADRYVHDSPWNAVGLAAGIGFLVGCLAARR